MDQLAKETLDHDIDPLTAFHYADLKSLVNCFIQRVVQVKWGVSIHGRGLYLLKPTPGLPKRFWHLTRGYRPELRRLWQPDSELTIPRPQNSISCPEDHRLLASIVARPWPLNTYSWNVQCCSQVVMNTTQWTHWGLSLRRSPRLAYYSFSEELDYFIWYEWPHV